MINFKAFIKIWNLIIENGVVLYGAGQNAKLATEVLHKNSVKIHAISDRVVGKKVGDYEAVSLEDLCTNNHNAVAIITLSPKIDCAKESDIISKHFDVVTNITIIHYAKYMFPDEREDFDYNCFVPFNNYESPYPTMKEVIFNNQYIQETEKYMNIDLNMQRQLDFLETIRLELGKVINDIDNNMISRRFESNSYFDNNDAVLLYVMLMAYRPKKIIEIGSGYSTCIMLDVNEYKLNSSMRIKCIEPYPERLFSRIREKEDGLEIRRTMVQTTPLEEFKELGENDILFIDSSHVTKSGGDIPYEYFNILPQLKSGVIIHIHDIFYPFVYPDKWLREGRAYTEAYVLRALLENNDDYEILFWNDMMQKKYAEQYKDALQDKCDLCGGSLWLRKK